MTKAIFFDIDGTLVSFKTHTIPQSALDAIHRVREKGIKVFIATGRPLPFIDNLEGLEYDGIMCVNGAYCIDKDGTIIHKAPVSKEDVYRIIDNQKSHPMPIAFASNDGAIFCCEGEIDQKVREVFTLLNLPIPSLSPIENALKMDIMQVIAFFNKDEEERIMSEVLKECASNRWHPDFTDCIAKGTNKATGIDAMIQYYGISLNETMAFGDGGNDIEMLRHAGIGVAMGNASDEVKDAADIVTTSVDDDGVANILNNL